MSPLPTRSRVPCIDNGALFDLSVLSTSETAYNDCQCTLLMGERGRGECQGNNQKEDRGAVPVR